MSSEEITAPPVGETDAPPASVTFKVKSSSEGNHTITMPETASVLDLKNKLSGDEFENVPADRQRLIYSGRVMKNEEPLSAYKIKTGNTIHMVKSAQSNVSQNPTSSGAAASAAAGVPTNMAAGTANNPLAALTGARFAGHMGLPDAGIFGADGGMGAPPSDEAMATMLEDPNIQASLNEALNNPAMIDMMIQSSPLLRDNPQAREMLQSPGFRAMLTNGETMRQASQLRRQMASQGMGGMMGGAASAFPAPGITDTTPARTENSQNQGQANRQGGSNPFLDWNRFQRSHGAPATDASTRGSGENANAEANNAQNPFAAMMGNGGNTSFGPGGPSPAMIQQAMQMLSGGDGAGAANLFGTPGGEPATQPQDTRPPEERFAEQLRQLNDMGFFDFDRNVEALRRSGGNVEGAVEQLLR